MSKDIVGTRGNSVKKSVRTVSLLVAGIALISFIVKDAIKDDLHEVVDSIERARDMALLRKQLVAGSEETAGLRKTLNDIQKRLEWRFQRPGDPAPVVDQLEGAESELQSREVVLDSATRLIETMPSSVVHEFSSQLSDLRKQFEYLQQHVKSARQNQFEGTISVGGVRTEVIAADVTARQSISEQRVRLVSESNEIVDNAIKAADETRAREEIRLRYATYISWFLFLSAWTIGLVTGVKEETE